MTVTELFKKTMLAGIGAQEKAKELIDELVKAGELSKSDAAAIVKEWTSKAEQGTKDMDVKMKDVAESTLSKLNIASRDDLQTLEKKIQSLTARIAKLELEREGGKGI